MAGYMLNIKRLFISSGDFFLVLYNSQISVFINFLLFGIFLVKAGNYLKTTMDQFWEQIHVKKYVSLCEGQDDLGQLECEA